MDIDGCATQLFPSDDDMDLDDEEDVIVDVCCPKCTKPLVLKITHTGELYLNYAQKSNKGTLFSLSTSGTSISVKKRKLD